MVEISRRGFTTLSYRTGNATRVNRVWWPVRSPNAGPHPDRSRSWLLRCLGRLRLRLRRAVEEVP
jgi:hypothetical protein